MTPLQVEPELVHTHTEAHQLRRGGEHRQRASLKRGARTGEEWSKTYANHVASACAPRSPGRLARNTRELCARAQRTTRTLHDATRKSQLDPRGGTCLGAVVWLLPVINQKRSAGRALRVRPRLLR